MSFSIKNSKAKNGSFSDEFITILVNEYQSGEKTKNLSIKYGVSSCGVINVLRKKGIEIRKDKGPQKNPSTLKILDLNKSGLTVVEICKIMGFKEGAVRHLLYINKCNINKSDFYINDELKVTIIDEYKSGIRTNDLSKKYGYSRSAIVMLLNSNGVKLRKDNNVKSESGLSVISLHENGYTNRQICSALDLSEDKVRDRLAYYGLKSHPFFYRQKCKLNDDYFNKIDNQEKAYFLGLLFADGNISSSSNSISISLKKQDGYLIERLKEAIESTAKIGERTFKNNPTWENQRSISISSEKMRMDLIGYGCTPRKSLTLIFPDIEKEYFWHFLRGYFDGDGCICVYMAKGCNIPRKMINIVGSNAFNLRLKELLSTYGINSLYKDKGNYSSIVVNRKDDVLKIRDHFYSDAIIFMERKRKKFYQ